MLIKLALLLLLWSGSPSERRVAVVASTESPVPVMQSNIPLPPPK